MINEWMGPVVFRTLRSFWSGGWELRKRQKELEQTQWFSREQLEALQLTRLQKLIRYAYENVPYYHKVYKQNNIHPEDIKSFQDFQALPFLTREDIKNHLDDLVTRDSNYKLVPNSTGGSTGVPMQFFSEKAFSWWDPALELRGRGWYGVGEGERIALVWGAMIDMRDSGWGERLKARILQERYLNAFNMTEQNMRSFSDMLLHWKPAMFRAYASALTLFAQYLKDNRITGIRPKFIETAAEKVTLPQRELLEEVFSCKVADLYSTRELGTIAFQCPEGGLHVCETRYLEIIANQYQVQPGELGEVVITSLHQFGMPFIRYKIGDMAISQPETCPCGRNLPVLSDVIGRVQDFLVTSKGLFVHGTYFPQTFRLYPEIKRYQVYQPDKKHLDVRLVCNGPNPPTWFKSLHCELQSRFGVDMEISMKIVDDIPLTPAGKHRSTISDVKPDFV